MRIEKLDIRGFGKIEKQEILLKEGLNVIFGENESGKSTLWWFIKGMLFGLKGGRAAKDGLPPPLKRFKPWKGDEYSGFMEYRLNDGKVYRVGRNFNTGSTRVFDSLFNDITGSFEVGRDKSILFAEKHLGLNEVCFEKTAFIRQMETRLDGDDSRELVGRLANVAQTGYEDISFIKAEKSLKEALKLFVGTDRTSTRPLDRILNHLDQLRSRKNNLILKIRTQTALEQDLEKLQFEKEVLLGKKEIFELAALYHQKKSLRVKAETASAKLQEVCSDIESHQLEQDKLLVKKRELESQKEEFKSFQSFDAKDAEAIGVQYQRLVDLQEAKLKLDNSILKTKADVAKLEHSLEPLKGFAYLGENIEADVLAVKKEIEYYKAQYEGSNMDVINEKILAAKKSCKMANLDIILTCILSISSFISGWLGFSEGYLATGIFVLLSLYAMIYRNGKRKNLLALEREKRLSFVEINGRSDEINNKQNLLKQTYEKAGASDYDEFLKLKLNYDSLTRQLSMELDKLEALEAEDQEYRIKLASIRAAMSGKLMAAGIIQNSADPFGEEEINSFKYGVNLYRGLDPTYNLVMQRLEDMKANLQRLFLQANEYAGHDCLTIEQLKNAGDRKSTEGIELLSEATAIQGSILELIDVSKNLKNEILDFKEKYLDGNNEKMSTVIEVEQKNITGRLSEVCLQIKEYETLLKDRPSDDDEIIRIDEEIEILEEQKGKLEDTGSALNIALELLTEAGLELQRDFAPALNQRMSHIIEGITGGRYCDLKADDSLNLKAIIPETGDISAALNLSGGTIDQMYLALRLSMADTICSTGEPLPLIMDEVFAQYDDTRTGQTLKYLLEESLSRQILLFTCKRRELELIQSVCGNDASVIQLA